MRRWMRWRLLCRLCKCNVVTELCSWQLITSLVNCLTLRVKMMPRRLKCSERQSNVFYIVFEFIDWVIALYVVLDQCSHLTVLMEDPLEWPTLIVPDEWCEGWSAVKGDHMCDLHSVPVYWLIYYFPCGAWSVHLQIHLMVLMDNPQLTNIERARWMEWKLLSCYGCTNVLHSVPEH